MISQSWKSFLNENQDFRFLNGPSVNYEASDSPQFPLNELANQAQDSDLAGWQNSPEKEIAHAAQK